MHKLILQDINYQLYLFMVKIQPFLLKNNAGLHPLSFVWQDMVNIKIRFKYPREYM